MIAPYRKLRRLWTVALSSAYVASAVGASAGPRAGVADSRVREPEPVRVSMVGSSAGCGAGEFWKELTRRTALVRPAAPGEGALGLFVELAATPRGVQGRLVMVESGGRRSTRDIAGANCREVLEAMALIAALSVDPFASLDSETKPGPARDEPPPRQREQQHRLGWLFGYRLVVRTAIAPKLSMGQGISAGVGYDDGQLEPSASLELGLVKSGTVRGPESTSAAFDWRALRLLICPLRYQAAEWLSLRPCAVAEGGMLVGRGSGASNLGSPSTPWWALGGELAAGATLAGPLTLEAGVSLVAPLAGSRFFFEPDVPENTVYEVPSLALAGGVGLGLHFF